MNQAELKRHNAKMRQRKHREKIGRQPYAILACRECCWIFDRKAEDRNSCPQCRSERTDPAFKVYGKACYNLQFTQAPYKRQQMNCK